MRPRRPRLEGKTAVITGIASGQGRAAALLFAAEGAVIVGCDMNDDGAAATVGLVRQAGGEAFSSRVDLTDDPAVAAWASDVSRDHTQVHILYANAAATRFAPVDSISHEDWQWNVAHEMDVVFLPVRHFWGRLKAAGGAAVVLVGSTAGVTGSVTNGRLAHTASRRPSRWAASVRRRRWPPAPSSSPPTRPPTSLAQTS